VITPQTFRTVRLLQSAIQITLAQGADQHNTAVPQTNTIFLGGKIL